MFTALMRAAQSGHAEIVAQLLAKGARKDFRDKNMTALMLAVAGSMLGIPYTMFFWDMGCLIFM